MDEALHSEEVYSKFREWYALFYALVFPPDDVLDYDVVPIGLEAVEADME